MEKILVLEYTKEISHELRGERTVTVQLRDARSLEVGYIMIAGGGVPVWIAKVDSFFMSGGPFPKKVKASLGEVTALEQSWSDVARLVEDVGIDHGKIIDLDIPKLLFIGKSLNLPSASPGTLTVQTAVPRLAWTYGVPEENVKIAIEF